ncbi:hypothetical protein [Limoniibacter endophyticus]|uniref:hypothetical protein n=1 Tax=Limoniibacter endophyticus TaxID=1565040 RepID=UPI0016749729|nr:hypothetical protein [Limoniibacter endophyticus]
MRGEQRSALRVAALIIRELRIRQFLRLEANIYVIHDYAYWRNRIFFLHSNLYRRNADLRRFPHSGNFARGLDFPLFGSAHFSGHRMIFLLADEE